MHIFLLRHSETETNRDGALATGSGDALTQHGHYQAKSIIGSLLELEIECIMCSPYPRALQTIQPFAEVAKIEVEVQPCLAEGSYY
ncbi:hypothetical protein CLM76_14080 [Vreelandella venusta]|nr:hypothetical protein CLM76_14080 [Halomonas hydrothermalis]